MRSRLDSKSLESNRLSHSRSINERMRCAGIKTEHNAWHTFKVIACGAREGRNSSCFWVRHGLCNLVQANDVGRDLDDVLHCFVGCFSLWVDELMEIVKKKSLAPCLVGSPAKGSWLVELLRKCDGE